MNIVNYVPINIKKYKVTPVKNRFVPDIIKNGRIEEPGIYSLNPREVHRAMHYGYLVEEIDEGNDDKYKEDPNNPDNIIIPEYIPDNQDNYLIMNAGRIGYSKLYRDIEGV